MILKIILNTVVFMISLLMLCKASLWDVNWLNYESPIEHKDYKKISLKDFKGLNRPGNTLDGMKEFAFIVTAIQVFKSGDKYHVVSLFYPSRSYTYKKEFELDEKLLKHELYHFHITEYWARTLRKQIANTNADNDKIPGLKRDIDMMENAMQGLYDYETYHGYVLNEQIFWQKNVDSLLNCLAEYKETEININH
jgi:hypothetical protein